MITKHTDTSIPAILAHVERQFARGDIATITRAQWQALKVELDRWKGGHDADPS